MPSHSPTPRGPPAPPNHLAVAQDLSRSWSSSTVMVAVPCPPLAQTEPVPRTLCPNPPAASTAQGCDEIPIYATHCAQCPVFSGQGLFGFRSHQDQARCQAGLWGQQPVVEAGGAAIATAHDCGPATYQHPGPTLRLLDPTAAAAVTWSPDTDLPRTALGLCLPCAPHHGSEDGRQCAPCAAGTHRLAGSPACVSCPAPTQQSNTMGCVGCPAGWVPSRLQRHT